MDETSSEWFDRVMAENEICSDVVLSESDITELFEPANNIGVVYYDERSGDIRGVSQYHDPELAEKYAYLEIEASIALELMTGLKDHSKWMVAYQGGIDPILLPRNTSNITLRPIDDKFTVVTGGPSAPIQITIVVPNDEPTGSVLITVPDGLTAKMTEPLLIMISSKNNPDEIIATTCIDIEELLDKGEVSVDFGRIIDFEVDIISKPLTSVQFELQPYHERLRPIPLPQGRFVELIPFDTISSIDECDPGVLVDCYRNRLVVSLHEAGGRFYDRPLSKVIIALSRPGDPDVVLWNGYVNVEDLRIGPVTLSLKQPIDEEFELLSPRFYANSYMRDMRMPIVVSEEILPIQKSNDILPGLAISVEADHLILRLVGDGGRRHERDTDDIQIWFTDVVHEDMLLWTGRIALDAITKEGTRLDFPENIEHFDIRMPRPFEYVYRTN